MKKMISILLALIMMLTAIPVQNIWATELEEVQTAEVEGETITFEDDSVTNDELFAGYVERLLYPETGVSTWTVRSAGDKLSGTNLAIYTKLKGKIKETASGTETSTIYTVSVEELDLEKTSWTAEELNLETLIENNKVSDAAGDAVNAKLNIDMPTVFDALLADCPYELYWFDKTASTSWSTYAVGAEIDETGTIRVCPIDEMSVKFCVSSDYAESTYVISTDKIEKVKTAIANASDIVEDNAEKSDFEKLDAYRQKICELVSYNDSAAKDDTTPYGDPWQLISVFDGDADTNVVCEGYSKAFQYLCDLTIFEDNDKISCICVTGTMTGGTGSGAHMWNIVSMDDGSNYLVDVTNCDTGTIGAETQLFLVGGSGSVEAGYRYVCEGGSILYAYDSDTKALYDSAELQMSSEDYVYVTHNWGEGDVTKEATCTEPGVRTYTCTDEGCEEIKTEEIEALGHSYEEAVVEPTCTAKGYTIHKCVACGNTYTDRETATIAHEYEESITTEASCTEVGKKTLTCKNCGDSKIEEIKATGHSYEATVVSPTCTTKGYTTHKCSKCEDVYTDSETAMIAHDYKESVTKAATCTEAGVKTLTCGTCGDSNTEVIEALGHSYEATVVSPTCTTTGYTTHKCSECEDVYTDSETAMIAHDYKESVTKAATCTEAGVKTFTCRTCGVGKTEVIEAAGHKWETTLTIDKAPTCTATGQQSIHCSVCNKVKSGTETTIPAKGHSGEWKVKSQATVFSPQIQQRTCNVNVCKTVETKSVGKKVEPVLELPGNLTKLSIKKGKSATFTVTMEAGDYLISCESSNKNVKVDYAKSTGKIKITGKKKGKAILTIALKGYGERTYEVNVTTKTIKTSAIAIPDTKVTLKKGATYKINVTVTPFTSTEKVTYKSSNKKVATVSSAGKITAKGPGTATITVKSGSKKKSVKVTVIGITGVSNSLTIKKGKTKTLKPKKYGISETFTFISSKTSVATISETGKIKAKKKGKTTITIIAGTYKVTCKVTVK